MERLQMVLLNVILLTLKDLPKRSVLIIIIDINLYKFCYNKSSVTVYYRAFILAINETKQTICELNYFNVGRTALKYVSQYYYRKGIVYTDKFWELTNDFIDKIVDIKIPVKYGQLGIYMLGFTNCWMRKYKNLQSPLLVNHKDDQYIYYLKNLTVPEYQAIAKEYIMSFLKTIESKKYLVLDQILTTSKPDTERKLQYLDDFKCICVWRYPRDIFATGIIKNEQWIPKNPNDFVKWYFHRGTPAYLAENHPNKLMIRFEDLVLDYRETTTKINEFLGLDRKNHIHKQEYFNPQISIKNIGLYKTLENDSEWIFKICFQSGG